MYRIYLLKLLIDYISAIFWTANVSSLLKSGYSLADSALIMAAFYLSIGLFETPTGLFADRSGRKKSTLFGLSLIGTGFLLLFELTGKIFNMIGMGCAGIGFTLVSGAFTAWALNIARERDSKFRQDIFFLKFDLFGRISMICGGFTGVFFLNESSHAIWGGLFVIAALAVTVAYFIKPGSHDLQCKKDFKLAIAMKNIEFAKHAALLLVFAATLAFGLEQGIRNTIYQSFVLKLREGDATYLAYWQSGMGLARLCGILFYRNILIRINKPLPLALLSFCVYATTELLSAYTDSFWFIISCWLTTVFTLGWYFPIKDNYINSLIPENFRATLLSFDNMLFQFGSGITCLLLYFVLTNTNFQKFWIFCSFFLVCSTFLLFLSSKKYLFEVKRTSELKEHLTA